MAPSMSAAERLKATANHLYPPGIHECRATWTASHRMEDDELTVAPYFTNNQFISSKSTKFFPVHDPATNCLVRQVPQNTREELEAVVATAGKAFPVWRATSVIARQRIMFNLVHLIKLNTERLAACITLEQGKTLDDARGDVKRGLQVAEAACSGPELLKGELLEVAAYMETRSYREPLGVVAAICPFNFPAMIPLWILPIAAISGNTLVIKPSERVPGAALILAELCKEAGFPDGVVNIIHGGHETVNFILDEPEIKAISFVGSNQAGEYIFTRGSANGKRVQANLGAKNHAVVLPDCNKHHFLNNVAGAAFGAAGQRCMALSVLVMVGSKQLTDLWVADLVEQAKKLIVGGGFDPKVDMGPVISPEARQRIESLVESAVQQGATVALDGRGYKSSRYPNGNWVGPTIITDVTTAMRCYQEEIFGPVLVCLCAESLQEGIDVINANAFGNGACIFTNSGPSAEIFRKHIEAGQIGINASIPVPLPMFSFTGNKQSIAGGGASTFYGRPGISFFTQQKTVTSLWAPQDTSRGRADVTFPTNQS